MFMKHIRENEVNPSGTAKLRTRFLGSNNCGYKLKLDCTLKVHSGCVNAIEWSEELGSGQYLLSASDDKHLVITNAFNSKVAQRIRTTHRRNMLSAKFLSCNKFAVVSSSADGAVCYTQIDRPDIKYEFLCHSSTVYQVHAVPAEKDLFLTCSDDKTVRLYDLRKQTSCADDNCGNHVLINSSSKVYSMAVDRFNPNYIAVATGDAVVRIYDRRKIHTHAMDSAIKFYQHTTERKYIQTTYLQFDHNGSHLLANFTPNQLVEINTQTDEVSTLDDMTTPANDNYSFRLGGDWSDTGPASVQQPQGTREQTRMERMLQSFSSVLSRFRIPAQDDDMTEEEMNELSEQQRQIYNSNRESRQKPYKKMTSDRIFTGHRNKRTTIKQCNYWGRDLILAGSDCGHIYIWDRCSQKLLNVVEADRAVVNCIQPHPEFPVLASSGIDYNIKLWSPSEQNFNTAEIEERIQHICERNSELLRPGEQTVTVPARTLLPFIALMARRQTRNEENEESSEEELPE